MKSKMIAVVLAAAFGCAAICQNSLAQTNDWLAMIKELYGFSTWAGQTKVHYEKTVTNWVPDFGSLGVTNFLQHDEGQWTNSQKYSRYSFLFGPGDSTNARAELTIDERQDVTNAHWAMIQWFSNAQAVQPFPLGSELGLDIGDRCYLGWGVTGHSFAFVRNNVFVWVFGAGSVLELARKLDCELVRHSFAGPILLNAGKNGSTFYVSVPTTVSNTYVLEYKDSLAGTNWSDLQPFTGDGTIRLITYPAFSDQEFFRLRVY